MSTKKYFLTLLKMVLIILPTTLWASQYDAELLQLTNAERQTAGLSPLGLSSQLGQAAQAHAEDMANNNYFSHTGLNGSQPSNRVDATGYVWYYVGENIAAGYSTPAETIQQWMDSQGHRENILSPNYTEIGFGYAYSVTNDYGYYWVQVFGTPQSSGEVTTPTDPDPPVTTPTDPPVATTEGFSPFLGTTWDFSVQFPDEVMGVSYLFDSETFTHDDGRVSLGAVELPVGDIWVLLPEENSESGLPTYSLFTFDKDDNLLIYFFTCNTVSCDDMVTGTLELYYADDTVGPSVPFTGTRQLSTDSGDEEPEVNTPPATDSGLFPLGGAKAINLTGFTNNNAQFSGSVSSVGMTPATIQFVPPDQLVGIKVSIQVDSADVGKMADILFVIGLEPFSPNTSYAGDADTSYIAMTAGGYSVPVDLYAAPQVWMEQLSEPYRRAVPLESQLTLDLGEWSFQSPGMRYLFVGYRLEDGTIVYSAQPLMVEIMEENSDSCLRVKRANSLEEKLFDSSFGY